MAVIQKEIKLVGSKGERGELALFDSGATYSCLRPDIARELGNVEDLPEPMEFGTAKEGEKAIAKERVSLNFYIDGYRFSDEFMLVEDLSEPVIIGAKTLQAWRLKLDFENDEIIIDPRVTKLRLLCWKVWSATTMLLHALTWSMHSKGQETFPTAGGKQKRVSSL